MGGCIGRHEFKRVRVGGSHISLLLTLPQLRQPRGCATMSLHHAAYHQAALLLLLLLLLLRILLYVTCAHVVDAGYMRWSFLSSGYLACMAGCR